MINKFDEQKEILKGLFTRAAIKDIENDRENYNIATRCIRICEPKDCFTSNIYEYICKHSKNKKAISSIKIADINEVESVFKSLIIRSLADNKEEFHAIDENYGISSESLKEHAHLSIRYYVDVIMNKAKYMADSFERDKEDNVKYVKLETF